MTRVKPRVRLSVRAVILRGGRLLLVNAWPGDESDLWCVPGGGVEPHASLPDNLIREIHEETGIAIRVGAPCLVNEFHDPESGIHQVDIYFRATALALPKGVWIDTEGVVNRQRWVNRDELQALRFKPDSLPEVAFGGSGISYDPLELSIR
ncbi:NUDIX domain-containing protein [Pararhodobacter aggregans]|uniref:NUDIX domain-containing protein n=1 Tax=Pararhodobacter aggregans TaxID=404875 RepID=UPI003A8DFFD0